MKLIKCRKCGGYIHFVATPGGKSMPCDPEPKEYWEVKGGRQRIVRPDGVVVACELEGTPGEETGVGFVPHWATCAHAGEFRKGGKVNGK